MIAADPLPHRREAATNFGADLVIDPGMGQGTVGEPGGFREPAGDDGADRDAGGAGGVDVAFEIAGPTMASAWRWTRCGPGAGSC